MTRYTVHLDASPPPDLANPDWPQTCPETPADYVPLSYNEWHDMAAARTKRGETQRWCPCCERWAWVSTPCKRFKEARS